MRCSILVLIFAALVMLSTAVFPQESPATVETKIIALEKAWNQAYKWRDKKALVEILHDSIILVNDDGRVDSRSTFLSGVEAAPSGDEQQAEPGSITVRSYGDVAVATGVYRTKEMVKGRLRIKRNRFVDTWISRDHMWVCISASATPILP